MTGLVEVTELHVAYRHVEAVRGMSLHVEEGEIVTVLGLNGAGKTTLLQAIVGRVRPKQGRISFAGSDITRASMTAIARRGVSLVPEGRHIFPRMTVAENLRLAATTVRGRPDAAGKLARALERYPALERLMGRPAGLLSGGEQQQLAIARALLTDPRLLILDEPSLGLAPSTTDRLFETIADLRAEGTTILIVEQNVGRTLAIADRAYVMARGVVTLEGAATDVMQREDVSSHYFGEG